MPITPLDFPDTPTPNEHFVATNGVIYLWNAQMGLWVVLSDSPAPGLFTPAGAIIDFGGVSAPSGWYLCDGELKNREIDSALFAAIGELYGAGDGETTFALPDLRGRVTCMRDLGAGRMGIVGNAMGAVGGADAVALSGAHNGPHDHQVYDPGHQHGLGSYPLNYTGWGNYFSNIEIGVGYQALYIYWLTDASPTGVYLGGSGSGTPHNNTQPTMALNKIIKR